MANLSSAASSTSRLRFRNSYSVLHNFCSKRAKSRLNISSTRQGAAQTAAIKDLIAEEEERIRNLKLGGQESDEGLQSIHASLVAGIEALEVGNLHARHLCVLYDILNTLTNTDHCLAMRSVIQDDKSGSRIIEVLSAWPQVSFTAIGAIG